MQSIELTIDNVRDYFLKKISKITKEKLCINSVEEVNDYTNSAYIFKITASDSTGTKNFYLKQTREKVKKKDFHIHKERGVWEAENARKFNQYIGETVAPEFLYVDEENCVSVMDDALSNSGEMLISAFKRGELFPEHGKIFGRILGKLHGNSYGAAGHMYKDDDWNKFLTDDLFRQHYYTGFQKFFDDKLVDWFVEESAKAPHAFCHMDLVMKNIIINPTGARILDFEGSTNWDPAIDVGVFLMPWVIEISKEEKRAECTRFITDFFAEYNTNLREKGVSGKDIEEIAKRSLRMTAVLLIHHTKGSDPYDFLAGREDEICDLAIDLLRSIEIETSRLIAHLYGVSKPLI